MTAPKTILIAGGSGLIGRSLSISLRERGHSVLILTRNPKSESDVFWNPYLGKIDNNKVKNVQVIINLIGEGIAEQKWTLKRKKELTESRVLPTQFLAEIAVEMKHLVYYIGASGVNCYGFKPIITPAEKSNMTNNPIYPVSMRDMELQKKLEYWKKRVPEMLLSPFNKNSWSILG